MRHVQSLVERLREAECVNENQLFMIRAIIVYNALPDLYKKLRLKPANSVIQTVNYQAAALNNQSRRHFYF